MGKSRVNKKKKKTDALHTRKMKGRMKRKRKDRKRQNKRMIRKMKNQKGK